jgi:hypothetical protein
MLTEWAAVPDSTIIRVLLPEDPGRPLSVAASSQSGRWRARRALARTAQNLGCVGHGRKNDVDVTSLNDDEVVASVARSV